LFKIRALNIYGWGDFSSEFTITASDVPSQMAIVTTSLVLDTVRIDFDLPSNNGESIDTFDILILESDGITYTADPTSCNGESDANIKANEYCDIPMSTLTSAPFSLPYNSLIQVKIRAHNVNGYGEYSQPNIIGEVALTKPDVMTDLFADISTSDNSNIDLAWTAPTNNGGSAITNYEIKEWNTGTLVWDSVSIVASTTTNLPFAGLTPGDTYQYQVLS